jgi:UDP-3-O-[3-hydroxymyristoyl] glucosamine N-acyltransferase
MSIELSDILAVLKPDVVVVRGRIDRTVSGPAALDDGHTNGTFSFCNEDTAKAERCIATSTADVVLCYEQVAKRLSGTLENKTLIGVKNPRLAFIRAMNSILPKGQSTGIDSRATVHSSLSCGQGVYVGPFAVIDANCTVGDETAIESGVRLYPETIVGAKACIGPGTIIGREGFGFERAEDGRLERFPHQGRVVIEDRVEIGANACIARGALGETRIEKGTKIDDLAYIAHNVCIGKDCLIMASTVIAGSASLGDRVEVSPGAIIRDKVRVGNGARIGLGAVVVRDVEPGDLVAGVPARSFDARRR